MKKETSPFPKQFPNWKPLSPETRSMLDGLQLSADPRDRLTSGYYTLQRHLILEDYFTMVKNCQDDGDFIDEAKNMMLGSMDELRKEYLVDVQLLVEMQLTMLDVWCTHVHIPQPMV